MERFLKDIINGAYGGIIVAALTAATPVNTPRPRYEGNAVNAVKDSAYWLHLACIDPSYKIKVPECR